MRLRNEKGCSGGLDNGFDADAKACEILVDAMARGAGGRAQDVAPHRSQAGRRPRLPLLHDRTLLAIAATRPPDEAALLAVPGFGPGLLERYGKTPLALCKLAPSPARVSFQSV